MNNPFDYTPSAECREAFGQLLGRLEELKLSRRSDDINFCRELAEGKMLGILIASDSCGCRHRLFAFSGQLGSGGFHHRGFVEPAFDYLQPQGYFKTKEAEITRMNAAIAHFRQSRLTEAKSSYESALRRLSAEVDAFREKCRLSRAARDARRESGLADEAEQAAMIRQSQFEKAELRRLKKRVAAEIQPFEAEFKAVEAELEALKEKRRRESEDLQMWLFSNFRLLNARGESKSLQEIFAETSLKVPPSGAGECCAPKLLQAAFRRGWQPEEIAEFWYGKSKGGEVRIHDHHYPACRGKCLPLLGWMLRGLETVPPLNSESQGSTVAEPEIIYENRWFCVINKPSGMLSVPGKGAALSLQKWLEEKYGAEREVKLVHRLDQATSGLIIAAFGSLAHKVMQAQFALRTIKKTYTAVLEGDYRERGIPRCGLINLPLSPDWLDRPRQRVDLSEGKEALTEYEFTSAANGFSRITFRPLTGRTHQLRVHAASDLGLGMPIAGDPLYGHAPSPSGRLLLHARTIEFTCPLDHRHYRFETLAPF